MWMLRGGRGAASVAVTVQIFGTGPLLKRSGFPVDDDAVARARGLEWADFYGLCPFL